MPKKTQHRKLKDEIYDVYLKGHGKNQFSQRYLSLAAAEQRCLVLEERYGPMGFSAYIKTISPPEKRRSDCGTFSV